MAGTSVAASGEDLKNQLAAACLAKGRASEKVAKLEQELADLTKTAKKGFDSLDFYDAVLTIHKITDVYDASKAWTMRFCADFDPAAKQCGVRVVPMGPFNNGKTWLISRLCDENLPSGTSIHTEGLSIKRALIAGLPIVVLDTIGTNSPVGSSALMRSAGGSASGSASGRASGSTPAALSKAVVWEMLEELRIQEDLYRQVAFKVATVVLLVVGQMSHKDQQDLVLLGKIVRKEKDRKDIVVVHNLREWSRNQLEEKGADGRNYQDRNMEIFGLKDDSLEVEIKGVNKQVTRHTGLLPDEGKTGVVINVWHFYLTNDHLECNVNAHALKVIGSTITNGISRTASVCEELAAAATWTQSGFVRLNELTNPPIIFDHTKKAFVSDPPGFGATLKPRISESFFATNADEVIFNVTAVPCMAVAPDEDEGEDEEGQANQSRTAYLIQIELPGLAQSSFKALEAILKSKARGDVLRKDSQEPDGVKVVVVDFHARLCNVPEGARSAAEEVVRARKESWQFRFHDGGAEEVYYEGSRARFTNGERNAKVTIWTNITDWCQSWKPIATYVDGILSITLIKERV